MELVFATHNKHKLLEVQKMLPMHALTSLNTLEFYDDIEETGKTFAENAAVKAEAIYNKFNKPVFADDSGLVIDALDGAPGIYSSRFAGTGKSIDNIHKTLHEMEGKPNRSARFVAVICLIFNGEKHFFEGKIEGNILYKIQGKDGFGYDPIFQPEGHNISFAEMPGEQKNKISHRAVAIQKMNDFISKL